MNIFPCLLSLLFFVYCLYIIVLLILICINSFIIFISDISNIFSFHCLFYSFYVIFISFCLSLCFIIFLFRIFFLFYHLLPDFCFVVFFTFSNCYQLVVSFDPRHSLSSIFLRRQSEHVPWTIVICYSVVVVHFSCSPVFSRSFRVWATWPTRYLEAAIACE